MSKELQRFLERQKMRLKEERGKAKKLAKDRGRSGGLTLRRRRAKFRTARAEDRGGSRSARDPGPRTGLTGLGGHAAGARLALSSFQGSQKMHAVSRRSWERAQLSSSERRIEHTLMYSSVQALSGVGVI